MILPSKYRLAFASMLVGIAVLLLAGGTWALFIGYGAVLTDAAAGSPSELQHLNDLFILQSWVLSLAVVITTFLSIALVVMCAAIAESPKAPVPQMPSPEPYADAPAVRRTRRPAVPGRSGRRSA